MNPNNKTSLILKASDIETIIEYQGLDNLMDELIRRLDSAIASYDPNKIIIPVRSGFHYDNPKSGLIEWMPLLKSGDKVMMKVVGYHPTNPIINNLPTILSTISAYDIATGHMIGTVDGVLLTALRTGAASALASRYMGHPDSSSLGIIGCGSQAVTQVHAISRIYDINRVYIYDISSEAMFSFQERIAVLGLDLEVIPSSILELVAAADILVTATTMEVGEGPLFKGAKTKPHLHVNAVGSDFPGKFELPLELLTSSFVCPDFPEQAILEGECQQLKNGDIGPGWVEVLQNFENYQELKSKTTVFDSTGWPLEDLIVMELFLEYGLELGLGDEVAIEHLSEDVKNPYHFLGSKFRSKVFKKR
jgi:ornithine cyclodeaminase/alanine dehydrogenase-like protein (mu-crystallin family)